MNNFLKRMRIWAEGIFLLFTMVVGYVILGSHFWPSEFNVGAWLKLNGVKEPFVQIVGLKEKGVSIYFPWVEDIPARVFAWIPNIVFLEGFCDLDVSSLKDSTKLAYLNVGKGWLKNHEMLIEFPDLLTVRGCIDAPFKNPILIERNRKDWHLKIRATMSNIKSICEGVGSEDYDLLIDDELLNHLSRKERNQLRNTRYRYINNWRRDIFFEKTGEEFFNGGKE